MNKILLFCFLLSFSVNAQNAFNEKASKKNTNVSNTFIKNIEKINGKALSSNQNITPPAFNTILVPFELRTEAIKRSQIANTAQATEKAYIFLKKNIANINKNFDADKYIISSSEIDAQGIYHVKMQQCINGVEILGGQIFVHTYENETYAHGNFIDLSASFIAVPTIGKEEAITISTQSISPEFGFKKFNEAQIKLLKYDGPESKLIVILDNNKPTLCYEISLRTNFIELWTIRIDAKTKNIIEQYNNTCHLDGTKTGTGNDLNGGTKTVDSYQIGSTYYMINASKPMYNSSQSSLPDDPTGAIWTLDAGNTPASQFNNITSSSANFSNTKAVSAHNNANVAYDYFKNTFGRNSINGKGGTIISVINVSDDNGGGMDNAYWNGQLMAYGNGKLDFKPLAGGLDVGGHEMTHGVVQNTANLEYKGQSGAINESMADVFGCMMDRTDWLLGEDVVKLSSFPSGALRSLQDPHNGGNQLGDDGYQPKKMSEYYTGSQDNGGVHINSGIPNHAYYLLATNITREKAEQIFYKALTTYLTKTSQFKDLRLATVQAAKDLYSITEASAVAAAFDAVGIYGPPVSGGPVPIGNNVADLPLNPGTDNIIYYDLDPNISYTLTKSAVPSAGIAGQITRNIKRKPSVVDDGSFCVYVGTDSKIYKLLLNGSKTETVLSTETIWDNVAISKDGKRLAAITSNIDTSIYVYDFNTNGGEWKVFTLYNPTFSDVNSGGVLYADALEFDHSGTKILYDAENFVDNQSGADYKYFDVGTLTVWDLEQNNWGNGDVEKLFSSLPQDVSIGNPVYSQRSPYIVAFDYIDASTNTYEVKGYNLNTNKIATIYSGTSLGFPCYNRSDNQILFNAKNTNNESIVAIRSLNADKITPSGSASIFVSIAKWGVWYATGTRALLFSQKDILTFGFEGLNPQVNATISGTNITCTVSSNVNITTLTPNYTNSPYSYVRISSVKQTSGVNSNNYKNTLVYTVVAQDGSTKNYNVTVAGGLVSVKNNPFLNSLSIYPNPVSNTLNIVTLNPELNNEISIYDLQGKKVKVIELDNIRRQRIDIKELVKGIYIVKLKGEENFAYKLIKE